MSSLDFDTIGDLQKKFEKTEAGRAVMPGLPVLARLDGRGFHNFTQGLKRPYDSRLSDCMYYTAEDLLEKSCASLVYTQSDEITLCWPNVEDTETKIFFGGKYQKMTSVLAAMASNRFNRHVRNMIPEKEGVDAVFDCRVWQVPNLRVAAENFLWREMDARKNSVSMAASTYFSHKELHGKSTKERLEMLAKVGVDFSKYPDFFKKGVYLKRNRILRELTELELAFIPAVHRPIGPVERTTIEEVKLPVLTTISNLADVLFFNQDPILHDKSEE